MTPFQLLMVLVFAGVVIATYGKDIYAKVAALLNKLPSPVVVPTPAPAPAPTPAPESANAVVADLLTVSALRDRFAADSCAEGVEACSILLKIIIDHKHPHAG